MRPLRALIVGDKTGSEKEVSPLASESVQAVSYSDEDTSLSISSDVLIHPQYII